MLKVLLTGFTSMVLSFVLWSIISWHSTHAILKNPFEDGYLGVMDLMIISAITGILIGVMYL